MTKQPRRLIPSQKRWTAATINFLTQDETLRLLDAIDSKRDFAIFLLAYRHGLRASEVGLNPTSLLPGAIRDHGAL